MTTIKFKSCTEDEYWYGLEVLPPRWWVGDSFLVGEPCQHRRCTVTGIIRATFNGFTIKDEQHLVTEHDVTLPEFEAMLKDNA